MPILARYTIQLVSVFALSLYDCWTLGGPSSIYSGTRVNRLAGAETHAREAESDALVKHLGEIANDPAALDKLCERLVRSDQPQAFCYEAGPCGCDVHRQLTSLGRRCDVIAETGIPEEAWRSGEDEASRRHNVRRPQSGP